MGRDASSSNCCPANRPVSIHTPVWGVTALCCHYIGRYRVSIHTPVWGVTKIIHTLPYQIVGFNPHARVGRDYRSVPNPCRKNCFNPHARVGRDMLCAIYMDDGNGFNPHSRVGRDLNLQPLHLFSYGFNPHARVGRDSYKRLRYFKGRVSIHTPVWGVTHFAPYSVG